MRPVLAQTFVPGFLRDQVWMNQTRATVEAGTAGTPTKDGVSLTAFEAPVNTGVNNYAQRVSGFFIPPVSGNYVFFVNSDDDSDLFLSTDNTPANKRLIAQEAGWSNPDQWLSVGGGSTTAQKRSDQFTDPVSGTQPYVSGIPLVAGQHYYIEADHHQGGGGDNCGATFKLITAPDPADGTPTSMTNQTIGVLLTQIPTNIIVLRNVQNTSVYSGCEASFSFVTTNNAQPPISAVYQWYRNGSVVAGASSTAYTFLAGAGDNGAQMTCVASFPSPISLSKTSAVATLTVQAGTIYTNGLKREFFVGADRVKVETGNFGPAASVTITPGFELPSNTGLSGYAQRISGYFIPAVTTNYVFFVNSDDDSDLFLSTDSNPANKRLIAQEQNYSNPLEWITSAGGSLVTQKRSDQWSPDGGVTVPYAQGIPLTAGQLYYIEGVHHQGGGGDNFAATFTFSGGLDPTNGQPSALQATNNNVALITGTITNVVFTSQPKNTTVFDGQTAGFTASATSYVDMAPLYQWYRNGSPITNATSSSYQFVANIATDNGAQFQVVATSPEGGINITSSVAVLTVLQAVFEPGFLKVEFWSNENRPNVEAGNVPNPDYVTSVSTPDHLPINDGINNYAQRLSGLFIPPVTGSYVFFVNSDDDSDLFLSTDNTPVNKRLIAQETGWSNSRQWVSVGGGSTTAQKRSDQFSPDGGVTVPYASGIPLTAGQKYYFEAVHAQGGGGDNLDVTYKLTTDPDPADGDASRLTNGVIGFNAPQANYVAFTQQPQSQTVVSAHSATFTAQGITDSGISVDYNTNSFVLYQWYRGGTAIPGATVSSYTTPLTLPTDNGAQFVCEISALGIATWSNSLTADLTVITDTNPPTLVYAGYYTNSLQMDVIDLTFNKLMDATTLAQVANYLVPGTSIASLVVNTDNYSVVELQLSAPVTLPLNLTVNNIKDYSGNLIAANSSIAVQVVPLANQDIGTAPGVGDPALPGIFWADGQGAYIISAEGSDIWNNADGFNFSYELKTNDFDVVVRQRSITHSSNWAKAGLMARETLDPGSRNWNIVNDPLASDGIQAPDGSGFGASVVECNSRVSTNGASATWTPTGSPAIAPAYPNAWVRLKRAGQVFTAYSSTNGADWTLMATQNPQTVGDSNALPAVVYVGICVTAHNNDTPGVLPYRYYNTSVFDSYNSSYVAPPPLPVLTDTLSGKQLTISWTPIGGHLESSPALTGSGVNWQSVGTLNPTNITVGPGTLFFRVVSP